MTYPLNSMYVSAKSFVCVLFYLLVNQVHGAAFKAAAAAAGGGNPTVVYSGANDRHKFGGLAEHALAHTRVSRKLRRRRLDGEAACEDRDLDRDACGAVGCCEWDDGECWSSVGSGACAGGSSGEDPCEMYDLDMVDAFLDAVDAYLADADATEATYGGPIGEVDMSCVTDMREMFEEAYAFNAAIDEWDVSSVTDMEQMFYDAKVFNGAIGAWDVSSVTDMQEMFSGAEAFNGVIGAWDVSSVTSMNEMFGNAYAFNRAIDAWAVSSVTSMYMMFYEAGKFDQDLGWCVGTSVDTGSAFVSSACAATSCGITQGGCDGSGGGDALEELTEFCEDTAGDARDTYGDGCEWYDANPQDVLGECGFYDDDDFTANDMCCACNGGTMKGKTRNKSLGVGSVVIIVPVIIGAVILAAVAYAVARKRRVAAKQHRNQSMPSVLAE